jgi:hypothetical protein
MMSQVSLSCLSGLISMSIMVQMPCVFGQFMASAHMGLSKSLAAKPGLIRCIHSTVYHTKTKQSLPLFLVFFQNYFSSMDSSIKKYQIWPYLVPTLSSRLNLVLHFSSARFTFKTPFLSPKPPQMSSGSSNNNMDDSNISIVADSRSCNTRAASSAGRNMLPCQKQKQSRNIAEPCTIP